METAECSSCGLYMARAEESVDYSRSMAKVYCGKESEFDLYNSKRTKLPVGLTQVQPVLLLPPYSSSLPLPPSFTAIHLLKHVRY
jgi:hypothetical protein